MGRTVFWAFVGPVIFLVVVTGFSVVAGMQGVAPDAIGEVVAGQGSAILLVALLIFAALTLSLLPLREIWRFRASFGGDVVIGGAMGVAVALAYLWLLAPMLGWAQGTFGDYVPPGSVGTAVSGNLILFFVANVILAPAVEETVYRGFVLPRLVQTLGPAFGVILSCIAFGLLHWLGGLWYMVLTGVVAGGLFAGLRLWRGSLLAPFAAHLSLNLVEFAGAWLR